MNVAVIRLEKNLPRHYALRSKNSFSQVFVRTLRENCIRWQSQIDDYMEQNRQREFVASGTYAIGPVIESESPRKIVIELSGHPTYGLLKVFEDGFPLQLLADVSAEILADLEVGYFNTEMDVASWRRLTDTEQANITRN